MNTKFKKRVTSNQRRATNSAFTLVEILITLAITALILTGIATIFHASITNYQQNQLTYESINSARQALCRITTQLRTADAVDPTAPVNECSFVTAEGSDLTYRFDNTDNTLYLITNDDTTDDDYLLCTNVSSMTFDKDTFVEDSVTKVRSVRINITVTNSNVSESLSAAAVIRRNLP